MPENAAKCLLHDYALLCGVAQCAPYGRGLLALGYQLQISLPGGQGYIATGGHRVIIGLHSAVDAQVATLETRPQHLVHFKNPVMVEEYAYEVFSDVYPLIRKTLLRMPHARHLTIVGHGVAGAAAVLLGAALKTDLHRAVAVVTFGAPRAGGADLFGVVRTSVHQYVAVVCGRDPYPWLPAGSTGADPTLHLGRTGRALNWLTRKWLFLRGRVDRDDHLLGTYQAATRIAAYGAGTRPTRPFDLPGGVP